MSLYRQVLSGPLDGGCRRQPAAVWGMARVCLPGFWLVFVRLWGRVHQVVPVGMFGAD